MPAPLAVDKEAVRVLVVALGCREAARQMQLDEDTVKSWSRRGGWLAGCQPSQALPASMQPKAIAPNAPNAADALANSMLELSKRGKLAYLRAGVAVGEHAAKLAEKDPDLALEQGQNVKAWAGTTSLAGGWAETQGGSTVLISVRMLGVRPDEMQVDGRVIDAEQS